MSETTAFKHVSKRGTELFLNSRSTTSKAGKVTTMYFFSKKVTNGVPELPAGYEVVESGPMPILKKIVTA